MSRRLTFVFGTAVFLGLLGVAILAPLLLPEGVGAQMLSEQLRGPSAAHWLGQNHHGQDLFTILLLGARASLAVGVGTILLSASVGVTLGLLAGYLRGAVDQVISRTIEIVLAFPGILLAIAMAAVMGPSVLNVVIALSTSGWVPFARLVRGQTLSLREREFVVAVRGLGASVPRILFRHILPNVSGPLLVQATFALAGAILAESSLSFLGLGVPAGTPSWGKAIADGTRYLMQAPHLATFPGIAIMLTVLSLHFVGDGLRERLHGNR
jgi:peptide/nickel transport system permease protein